MKIAILGAAGRMGKMLVSLAEGTSLEVVSKVDVAEGFDREWSDDVEGIIDFSHHSAIVAAIGKAAEKVLAFVAATVGHVDDGFIRRTQGGNVGDERGGGATHGIGARRDGAGRVAAGFGQAID